MLGLLKFLSISIALLGVVYLFLQFQDADLTVYFYEKFGLQPCAALQDKVVWITGASSGIGEYLAYELCKCGCKIVLSARRADELQRVKDKCSAIGMEKYGKNYDKDNLMILPLDLRKFESHADLTKTVLKHFNRIDVLVNNAGRSQRGWVKDTSLDIEQELLDLNTVGTMSLTKAVLPYMLQANSGQIVVLSSVMGKFGYPYEATYAASKFALHGYFDSLRMELSDSDINIQLVCPGPVQSNVAANAFTSTKNKSFRDLPSYTDNGIRMPTERCAYLMAVSMANKLDEVWISTNPMLAYTYMAQYMPTTFQWYSKRNFLKIMKNNYFKRQLNRVKSTAGRLHCRLEIEVKQAKMSALLKFLAIILPLFAVLKVIGLLTFLLISIALLGVVYLFLQFQDADLTVYFYEKFGLQPCAALQDKVVWITGASSGIGEYLAYELCKCGCKIVLSARRADELQRVKDKCSAIGMEKYGKNYDKDNVMILPLDLRKFESHADLTKTVVKHFNRIDVLVNNAGRSQRGWVKDTSLDIEQELLDLNTVGTMSLTKAVLPYMLQANSGQIVVVSSVSGKYGFPYTAAYCASKFALQGYFDSLRMELSDSDIHIQLVCPGPVQSNVAANAFTSIKNKSFKDLLSYTDSGVRMPTERCAYLMAVSMANKLDEVWISTNPMLAYTYMAQYMPTIFQWYSKGHFLSNTKKTFSSH